MSVSMRAAEQFRRSLLKAPLLLMGILAIAVCARAQSGDPARKPPPNERLGINPWDAQSFLSNVSGFTETGYVSRPQKAGARTDTGSPQNQARWAAQALQQAFDRGVERVYWLFLKDHPGAGYFASMGLLEAGGTPRPALSVLSQ